MPKLTVSVTDRTGALGGRDGILRTKVAAFVDAVEVAQAKAARTATQSSRQIVQNRHDKRPSAPKRANRYSGLAKALKWEPDGSGVALDMSTLNRKFPPWLVQEIGTGERAIQKTGGKPNPQGRPTKGASYSRSVKTQVGRKIRPSLVFATKGGKYTEPGARGGQQLYLRSQVKGAPVRFDRSTQRSVPGITIREEIDPKHFVQGGGEQGFREYRTSVLAAARSQLRKRRTR